MGGECEVRCEVEKVEYGRRARREGRGCGERAGEGDEDESARARDSRDVERGSLPFTQASMADPAAPERPSDCLRVA